MTDKRVWLLVLVLTVGRLLCAGWLGLSEDEAYYWVWSERLAAGYFDHPPAVAWVIRAGTTLLGDTERGVRAGGLLLGGLAALLAAGTSRAPLLAATALLSTPLLLLGGILATPDVPLVAAWAAGLLAATRGRWALVGLACGLAMLSKYTGVLLLPLLVLAQPSLLRSHKPYLAAAVAFVVYLPNAVWNIQHDLVSWSFQLDHVSQAPRRLDFLAAQLGLAGPLLGLAAAAWWTVGWRGDRVERLCWWTSLPVLVIATWAGGEANWAAPAWVSALVGLSCRAGRWERAAWVGAGLNATLCLLVLTHAITPLVDLPGDPTRRLRGGERLGSAVDAWGIEAVYTERYQEAALIHFYSGIPAHALPDVGRPDQYDLWPLELADHALFVRVHRGSRALPDVEALGYTWRQIYDITAYAPTTDPTLDVLIARWDVAEIHRP
jgi:4-amino-4-deoxy-L-arabinose transferase-like glycosyltransferase